MKKTSKVFLITGLSLWGIAIVALITTSLFPTTYFTTALYNVFVLPFYLGSVFILLFFLFRSQRLTFPVILQSLAMVGGIVLISMLVINTPIIWAVKDLQAVLAGDVYVTEGIVIDTRIDTVAETLSERMSSDLRYYQRFTLDNDKQDKFSYTVYSEDDYVFKLGETYKITALPYSLQILEYEQK